MKKFLYVILFFLFPFYLKADEFVVNKIDSENSFLKAIAVGIIKAKVPNKVSISVVGDIAYITYNTSKKSIEFHRVSSDEGRFFVKRKKSHSIKLFMADSSTAKEIYFVLEKNGKKKIRVTLVRV